MQPFPEPSAVLTLVRSSGVGEETSIFPLLAQAAERDAAHTLTGGAGFGADGATVEPEIADILVRSVARSLLKPQLSLAAADGPFSARSGGFTDRVRHVRSGRVD